MSIPLPAVVTSQLTVTAVKAPASLWMVKRAEESAGTAGLPVRGSSVREEKQCTIEGRRGWVSRPAKGSSEYYIVHKQVFFFQVCLALIPSPLHKQWRRHGYGLVDLTDEQAEGSSLEEKDASKVIVGENGDRDGRRIPEDVLAALSGGYREEKRLIRLRNAVWLWKEGDCDVTLAGSEIYETESPKEVVLSVGLRLVLHSLCGESPAFSLDGDLQDLAGGLLDEVGSPRGTADEEHTLGIVVLEDGHCGCALGWTGRDGRRVTIKLH